MGTTFDEALAWEVKLKSENEWKVQMHGDIVCYTTLQCNYGLLCLDWRDICDGVQQCMEGLDEENCDKLEFNECEDDEYRCTNGMCIPQEYFLDGQFDCLDWSDEIQYYNAKNCAFEGANSQCDDRMCPPNQWSCGDGQCLPDRLGFLKGSLFSSCVSRRDQFYMCEAHNSDLMWTLPNGRCILANKYDKFNPENSTIDEKCQFLLKCGFFRGAEKRCPCGGKSLCFDTSDSICSSEPIQFPKGGIVTPYILYFYDRSVGWFELKRIPDIIQINGTIKCRGFSITVIREDRFPFLSKLREYEDILCKSTQEESVINNNGYDRHCYNQSRTFNNRSYNFIDVCNTSKECISAYRIGDGIQDCMDNFDETHDQRLSNACSTVQRHRFRCSIEELTCLSVTALGNLEDNCKNKFDELWMGTNRKLSDLNCNSRSNDDCDMLRQYIEASWPSSDTNQSTSQVRIPFRTYCDTFWDLLSKEDENLTECQNWWVCPEDQWQCYTGQCINGSWVLDGEWDCYDASDEEGIRDLSMSNQSSKVVTLDELKQKFNTLYKVRPFGTLCNLSTEFPCLRADVFDPIPKLTFNRPCIRTDQIGDGRVDCYGAIDERNTLEDCNLPTMLGYHFKCLSSNHCTKYGQLCNNDHKCPNISDTGFWCDHQDNSISMVCAQNGADFKCFNGTCASNGQCNRIWDCPFGEDEYMCDYQSPAGYASVSYREEKEFIKKKTQQRLRLHQFPSDTNTNRPTNDLILTRQMTTTFPNLNWSSIPYSCNRGIGVQMYNDSTICFCPPQYYGDKCQLHSNRITVLFHLDLSQSIYIGESDRTIVLKLLVLFLFNNETLATREFHIRPVVETIVYEKKISHFVYSRSFESLRYTRQRYINRTNIINDHPYSICIEGYELKMNERPRLIAVWQYPIYFDYLPVFRLAKALRLSQFSVERNPCLNNPCNQNQQCQQLQNDKSKFICLCKSTMTGENCSVEDQQCIDGYCSLKALCKPNNRGSQRRGNKLPHCICPLNQFGERCHLEYDQCSSRPCQNGGSCFPTSKLDRVTCLCTDQYYGQKCELRKPGIHLYINETVHHLGVIVQYFRINFVSLDLILVHQQVFKSLPTLFEYRHNEKISPEIILAKLYSSHADAQHQIYLVSLHINVTSINGTTQVSKRNQCLDIRTLTSDYNPIKYHHICQINPTLICFYDKSYLCICSDDHSRVECFGYNHDRDHCSRCLAGGLCLKGDRFRSNDFVCLCPPCHSGTNCQFISNSFAFTLDQLFFTDLILAKQQLTFRLLIILPLLLFLLALPNNVFTFVTFSRRKGLNVGFGQYLLCMSVFNQITLGFLVARLIHLSVSITSLQPHPMVDNVLCKVLSYSLTCFTRNSYWLASFVVIERVYTALFLRGQWFKKPHIARRLMALTFFAVLISGAYELVFVKSFSGTNDGNSAMCVIEFPIALQSFWMLVHQIVSITNSILPLLINICSTIMIICLVIAKKMNLRVVHKCDETTQSATILNANMLQLNKQQKNELQKDENAKETRNRLHLLRDVLNDNKETIARPAITLIPSIFSLFSLPLFILSFSLGCQNVESSPLRYLLITFYFLSFIPQIITFFLYVYPSSVYSKEWQATTIGKWITTLGQQHSSENTTVFSTLKEEKPRDPFEAKTE